MDASGNRSANNHEVSVTKIPRAGVNQTSFRILITGPEDVIPVLARHMKNCILAKNSITNLKIHHAVALNEEIARKLSKDGLHAVVLCTDASKSQMRSNLEETLSHLEFSLVSTSAFILNIIHPLPTIFSSVADTIEKLAIMCNMHVVNILYEDEESVKFGIDRVSTAALRAARFIYGYEPPTFKGLDFTQLNDPIL